METHALAHQQLQSRHGDRFVHQPAIEQMQVIAPLLTPGRQQGMALGLLRVALGVAWATLVASELVAAQGLGVSRLGWLRPYGLLAAAIIGVSNEACSRMAWAVGAASENTVQLHRYPAANQPVDASGRPCCPA